MQCIEERRPPGLEESYDLEMGMIGPDGGDALRAFLTAIGSTRVHPLLDGWLNKLEPYRTTIDGFAEYWASLDRFRARMFAFLEDYDAIISPVCAHAALPHGTSIEERNFRGFSYTMTHNLTGWPAAVVRCGQTQPRACRSACRSPRIPGAKTWRSVLPRDSNPSSAVGNLALACDLRPNHRVRSDRAGVLAYRGTAQSVFGRHR